MYLTVPTTRSGKASLSEAADPDVEDEGDIEAEEESAEATNGSKNKKK